MRLKRQWSRGKRAKAPWTEAFPAQVKTVEKNGCAKILRDKAKKQRLNEYLKRKRVFLRERTVCVVWLLNFPFPGRTDWLMDSEDVHHKRGRLGGLLMDERFWVAVSRRGHDFIHANPELSRNLGLLCEKGEWGKQP